MLKSHNLFSQPWGDTLFYYCLVPHFVNWHVFLNSARSGVISISAIRACDTAAFDDGCKKKISKKKNFQFFFFQIFVK